MDHRTPFTAARKAELRASWARANAELAAWSAGVQAGTIRLEGAERDANRAGWWAGRRRLPAADRAAETRGFTPRQLIAYAVGHAEGAHADPLPVDAPQPPPVADLIRRARAVQGGPSTGAPRGDV